MSFFSLPCIATDYLLHESLSLEQRKMSNITPAINITLMEYINNSKYLIDSRQLEWNIAKKYTNTYEYIHTHVPGTKYSVGKLKPLSRSFYKLVEICKTMRLTVRFLQTSVKLFILQKGLVGLLKQSVI